MHRCNLCGQIKPLINSHIIPKWAYDYLYKEIDEKRTSSLVLLGKQYSERRPIGTYDNILCKECDNYLGEYDNYGKKVLLDGKLEKIHPDLDNNAHVIMGVNINKLRLFILSVLWRASISVKEECGNIHIGPYEEKIRTIIINIKKGADTTKELADLPIIITKFDDKKDPVITNKNIMLPYSLRIDSVNFAILYFPKAIKIFIKVDKRDLPSDLKDVQISDNHGGVIILGSKDFSDSNEFEILKTAAKRAGIIKNKF